MDTSKLPYRPCAGVCLVNADGLIWAGERIDTPGAWQMPQGGIDPGEFPQEAALRELEEETSVPASHVTLCGHLAEPIPYDLPLDLIPKLWGGKFRGQAQYWSCFELTGPDTLINIATDHPEFGQWQWMHQRDLIAKIVPFKREVYAQVFERFNDHLAP